MINKPAPDMGLVSGGLMPKCRHRHSRVNFLRAFPPERQAKTLCAILGRQGHHDICRNSLEVPIPLTAGAVNPKTKYDN